MKKENKDKLVLNELKPLIEQYTILKKWKKDEYATKPQLHKHSVISRSSFFDDIYAKPSRESIDKYERAFNAQLAYEKNCIAKYDYPEGCYISSGGGVEKYTTDNIEKEDDTKKEEIKNARTY